MSASAGEPLTLGVEEEYQIVHPETRELRPRADRVLPAARKLLGDEVTNELYLSQIEIGTPVCADLSAVRAQLVRLRRGVVRAAEANGGRIAAAGTHPFSHWEEQPITPKPRYRGLEADYRQLIREQVIFGCHVHVGVSDREAAVRAMNRARPWLAPVIALAANSPFWLGADTGYASYRTELFGRFPTAGVPQPFASRAAYDRLVADLVAAGMIEDASKIYWDVRPSSHVETLEFRAADVCSGVDETVLVAGLCRALVRASLLADAAGGAEPPAPRPELLLAAKWRACRDGLDGELIDPRTWRPAPAADVVRGMLAHLRPALEADGAWEEVSELAEAALGRGNGARRQREAFERGGKWEGVVDAVVAETKRGV